MEEVTFILVFEELVGFQQAWKDILGGRTRTGQWRGQQTQGSWLMQWKEYVSY